MANTEVNKTALYSELTKYGANGDYVRALKVANKGNDLKNLMSYLMFYQRRLGYFILWLIFQFTMRFKYFICISFF